MTKMLGEFLDKHTPAAVQTSCGTMVTDQVHYLHVSIDSSLYPVQTFCGACEVFDYC